MKIFIIHGSYGNPKENWFLWLKQELKKLGHTAFVPEFPTPEGQSLDNWMEVFNDFYLSKIDEDSILVGHSLGPAFILSVLEGLQEPVKACFFVSGFLGLLNNPEFDKINSTFTEKEFQWNKIKKNCEKFLLYHSNNDPYVPLEKSKELAEKLGVKVRVIGGAGHFNEKAGYKKFELLLKDIKKELK